MLRRLLLPTGHSGVIFAEAGKSEKKQKSEGNFENQTETLLLFDSKIFIKNNVFSARFVSFFYDFVLIANSYRSPFNSQLHRFSVWRLPAKDEGAPKGQGLLVAYFSFIFLQAPKTPKSRFFQPIR